MPFWKCSTFKKLDGIKPGRGKRNWSPFIWIWNATFGTLFSHTWCFLGHDAVCYRSSLFNMNSCLNWSFSRLVNDSWFLNRFNHDTLEMADSITAQSTNSDSLDDSTHDSTQFNSKRALSADMTKLVIKVTKIVEFHFVTKIMILTRHYFKGHFLVKTTPSGNAVLS